MGTEYSVPSRIRKPPRRHAIATCPEPPSVLPFALTFYLFAPPLPPAMRQIKACGVLVTRGQPIESFLLMKHAHRWDLPKGHVDGDETELECALRELHEETGIAADDIELDPNFRFTTSYEVDSERFGERCHKTVVIFLGRLKRDVELKLTEHLGCQWFPWNPPHKIWPQTIDPLLAAVEQYVRK